jgi:hypothetical protein
MMITQTQVDVANIRFDDFRAAAARRRFAKAATQSTSSISHRQHIGPFATLKAAMRTGLASWAIRVRPA